MNKKISVGLAVSLIFLTAALSCSVTFLFTERQYNHILSGLPAKLERYGILDELDDIINNNYYGKSDDEALEQAIAQGYLDALSDDYSLYMSASEYKDYLSERSGKITGIGIRYKKTDDNCIEITYVDKNSPAYEAGLRKSDIIIAFDGIMLDAQNYDEMTKKLSGDKLTSVNFIYRRGETETTVNISKGYEAVSVVTDVYENVGYIEINAFYSSTASQVKQAVTKFTSSQIDAIIIDLRNNVSDNYEAAMEILDIFVPMTSSGKAAASVTDKNSSVVKTYSTTAGEVNLPVGILVSKNTAQAAELFACNMKDFGKGLIFAETTTAGSAIVREIFELSDGSAVLLTTGTILPYSGVSFNGTGVIPDYILEKGTANGKISEDGQFLYAASVLVG